MKDYIKILEDIKIKVKKAQLKANLSVSNEMVLLYWDIGKTILLQQEKAKWGAKIITNLSKDLSRSFPDIKGFSERNLKYMRKFADIYPEKEFVQQAVAQIPWSHNIILMDKIGSNDERVWYAQKTIQNGWSRNVLVHQIELNLYERKVTSNKSINFNKTLPPLQSDLAEQSIKDPYIFDFLTLSESAKEREIENELVTHITKFLLELGVGFAFVGNQYRITIDNNDFYIDLLFYHLKLRCYFVIELKTGDFKPEYAGKMNFYLSAIDDAVKTKEDNPSIGLILCKSKNKIIAEYALRNMTKPMGIAEYKLVRKIPKELKSKLPEIKDIEDELS